jgi:hypothetical protein
MSDIKKILSTVDTSINGFMLKVPAVEKAMYEEILKLTKELKIDSRGRIRNTIDNYKILSELRTRLERVVFTSEYKKASKKLLKSFDDINKVTNDYFATFATSPTATTQDILKILRQESVNRTALYLGESGVNINVVSKVQDILQTNITSGGSYAQMQSDMKAFIQGDAENLGAFNKYANTFVVDGVNTYARTYQTLLTEDLNIEWYMYVGSLLETSRPWCKHMVDKMYIHKTELDTVLYDNVDGVEICSAEIPCNSKTKLPAGMKKDTTPQNLLVNAGGWNCGHKFIGVDSAVVPQHIKDKIKKR